MKISEENYTLLYFTKKNISLKTGKCNLAPFSLFVTHSSCRGQAGDPGTSTEWRCKQREASGDGVLPRGECGCLRIVDVVFAVVVFVVRRCGPILLPLPRSLSAAALPHISPTSLSSTS